MNTQPEIDIREQLRMPGRRGLIAEIAKELGLTHQAVSAWEVVHANHLLYVAEKLNVHPNQLRPDVHLPPAAA